VFVFCIFRHCHIGTLFDVCLFSVFSDIATFGHKAVTNGSTQCNKTMVAVQAQAQNKCGENYLLKYCNTNPGKPVS
jgi:hypothetical protein